MSEGTRAEIAVGAGVLAIAAGFLFYAAQAVGVGPAGAEYELRAAFRSVEGIRSGTDVRLAGVKIGSVKAMDLNAQSFMAETRLSIRQGIEIPDDSTAVIASEGLLGGNYVEISPGGSPFNLEPGSEIEDTQGSVSVISLMMKFAGGSDDDKKAGDE